MLEKTQSQETPIILRQSVICLSIRLIVLQLLFTTLYILILLPVNILSLSPQIRLLSYPVISIAFILVLVFQLYLTLKIILNWLGEYYIVGSREIIFRTGIIDHKEKIYSLSHIESITYNQNFWERLFNYGTIRLFNPVLKQHIHLDCIKNPGKYVRVLEQTMHDMTKRPADILFTRA
ncbi:PH domain-containing protein [Candidatus Gottesmanbacteria bacterium]|nr:PH domain-containing protein [Candidatus Gottesmanbacteria bacterium]